MRYHPHTPGDVRQMLDVCGVSSITDLFAPISGKVVEINGPLVDAPETVNEDPYEEGWMIVVEASDPKELAELLDAAAYRKFVEEEQE